MYLLLEVLFDQGLDSRRSERLARSLHGDEVPRTGEQRAVGNAIPLTRVNWPPGPCWLGGEPAILSRFP